MNFPHGVMVTVRSVVTTDDGLGNTSETVTESEWGPCAVAPRYTTESVDSRVPPMIIGKTVYGPPVALDSDDRLVIDGELWQVDGDAGEWKSPFTGWFPGVEVPVKRASAV